jgi:hypothetical protein
LACAHAQLAKFDDAWRCIDEAVAAVEATREKLWEADINRTAGEIALMSPKPDATKAQSYFESALSVARQQQAKSWELRAATSLARLRRYSTFCQLAEGRASVAGVSCRAEPKGSTATGYCWLIWIKGQGASTAILDSTKAAKALARGPMTLNGSPNRLWPRNDIW